MNKELFLGSVWAVGISIAPQIVAAQQLIANENKQPNIIFILADDMGYCDLSKGGKTKCDKLSYST